MITQNFAQSRFGLGKWVFNVVFIVRFFLKVYIVPYREIISNINKRVKMLMNGQKKCDDKMKWRKKIFNVGMLKSILGKNLLKKYGILKFS